MAKRRLDSGKENIAGRVIKTDDLLKVQKGAIVSSTLLNKPSGTITLFAFDKGQGLSTHKSTFDAFLHVLEGEAEIVLDDIPRSLKAGEMILMPANAPHAVRALKKFKMLLVLLR